MQSAFNVFVVLSKREREREGVPAQSEGESEWERYGRAMGTERIDGSAPVSDSYDSFFHTVLFLFLSHSLSLSLSPSHSYLYRSTLVEQAY